MKSKTASKRALEIAMSELGWRPAAGSRAPSSDEGAVAFLVMAPWCPDCREYAPKAREDAPKAARIWLVSEFAPAEESAAFFRESGLAWPVLHGRLEKTEEARGRAAFRRVREAFGDDRKWGLPLWIEGRIEGGKLFVTSARWA